MKTLIETITPDVAASLLAANTNNRTLNRDAVDYYKSQMLTNQWRLNGETIKVGSNGVLLDGQHRLAAIMESGVTLEMPVCRDIHPDWVSTIDTGRQRKPADHLSIAGFRKDSSILAAAAAVCMNFDREGKYVRDWKKTPAFKIIDWVEKNKGLVASIGRVPVSIGKLCPRSIAVAMHYTFSSYYGAAQAEIFFDHLNSGAELKRGSPILALRSRLIEMKNQRVVMSSSNRTMIIYYFVQAFKAWLDNREIKTLRYDPGSLPDLEESL